VINEFGVVSSQVSTMIKEAEKDVKAVAYKLRERETQYL